jgi:acetyl-CoA carboxylase carboxyltransferase component
MYDAGKALEAATQLEIDAVIDPAETRSIIIKALETSK